MENLKVHFNLKHPYHFDHPLDHIPGSYLIDKAIEHMNQYLKGKNYPVRFKTQFKNYANLNDPVEYQFFDHKTEIVINMIQNDVMLGFVELSYLKEMSNCSRGEFDLSLLFGKAKARDLKKHKPDNIAISSLNHFDQSTSLDLNEGHSLHQVNCDHLYLFELTKQFLYLYGRGKGKVKKDSSMSVFGIESFLNFRVKPGKGYLVKMKEKTVQTYKDKEFSKSIVEISNGTDLIATTIVEGVIL